MWRQSSWNPWPFEDYRPSSQRRSHRADRTQPLKAMLMTYEGKCGVETGKGADGLLVTLAQHEGLRAVFRPDRFVVEGGRVPNYLEHKLRQPDWELLWARSA